MGPRLAERVPQWGVALAARGQGTRGRGQVDRAGAMTGTMAMPEGRLGSAYMMLSNKDSLAIRCLLPTGWHGGARAEGRRRWAIVNKEHLK